MKNTTKKIIGVVFLILLVIVGTLARGSGHKGIGESIESLGLLGLLAIIIGWLHGMLSKK